MKFSIVIDTNEIRGNPELTSAIDDLLLYEVRNLPNAIKRSQVTGVQFGKRLLSLVYLAIARHRVEVIESSSSARIPHEPENLFGRLPSFVAANCVARQCGDRQS